MNKSVPTLLGIVIILLVVALVVLVYNYKLTQELGKGGQVVGTKTTEMLTGVEPAKEVIGAETVLGARAPKTQAEPSPLAGRATRPGSSRRGARGPTPGGPTPR